MKFFDLTGRNLQPRLRKVGVCVFPTVHTRAVQFVGESKYRASLFVAKRTWQLTHPGLFDHEFLVAVLLPFFFQVCALFSSSLRNVLATLYLPKARQRKFTLFRFGIGHLDQVR